MIEKIGISLDMEVFFEAGSCTFREAIEWFGFGNFKNITNQYESGDLVAIVYNGKLLLPTWQFGNMGFTKRSVVYVFRFFHQEGITCIQILQWFFAENKHLSNCRPVDFVDDSSGGSKLILAARKACFI